MLNNSFSVMKNRHVVRENRAFEMECIHNLENLTRVLWEYISTHDNINETIYDSHQPNNTLKSGFEVSCQPHEAFISTCILKLVQARKEDSGKYICYVGEENEAKSTNDSNLLKPVTEIELVVRGNKLNSYHAAYSNSYLDENLYFMQSLHVAFVLKFENSYIQ